MSHADSRSVVSEFPLPQVADARAGLAHRGRQVGVHEDRHPQVAVQRDDHVAQLRDPDSLAHALAERPDTPVVATGEVQVVQNFMDSDIRL